KSHVRDLPEEANTLIRPWPEMKYCHSSVFGCQCSSRRPPGATSTSAAAIVLAAGKFEESTMRTWPPSNFSGSCASSLYVNGFGTVPAGETTVSCDSGGGTGAANM